MTGEDFIPSEAEIDVIKNIIYEDVPNLAGDEDIDSYVRNTIEEYDALFTSQREYWANEDDGVWNQADAAFRAFANESTVQMMKAIGANEPSKWERAKLATTQFFRHVNQMASNIYSAAMSKDVPFRYDSVSNGEDEHAEERAERLNLLAKWSMKKDNFNIKLLEFCTALKKYGNVPVAVEWVQHYGTKTIRKPVFSEEDPTKVERYEFEDIDTIIENRPIFHPIPVESLKADISIGNIQDQECVIVSSTVGIGKIVAGIEDGYYRKEVIEELNRSHQWDGYSGFENRGELDDNRGIDGSPTKSMSGLYLKRDVFINLPIADGKWDEMKNVPRRYRVTMFGNSPNESVIARIEENQEPDGKIPIEMIHANPDNSDILYHISNFEIVRANLSTENTVIRQIIDNNTLVNKPPLIEERNAVDGRNREFGPDARFIADNVNSIKQFDVRDVSQSSLMLLSYIKDDSNSANSLDKNMVGESYGARTSSTEAGIISTNSRLPNMVNIEYILTQLFTFIADRYKVNWEAYGVKEQVVQITDENDELVYIRPVDIAGEFDIEVDVLDDINDNAVQANRMLNFAQVISQTPMAENIDWAEFTKELSEKMLKTSKFVKTDAAEDAEHLAKTNVLIMLNQGILPEIGENMNIRKHLEVYRAERKRWEGYEDQNQNVALLDTIIQELEQRTQQAQGQGQLQQPPAATETEMNRQEVSGAMGGISGI